jgi:formylglycine-generating enzyme required for sulfatase activity
MLHRCILIFLLVFSNASFAQPTENRVALVLGNSAYKSAPLRNPTNDAKDMAAKLKGMGFTVVERNNLTVKQIGSTLREFRSKLTPGSVALVFYAGHGLQIKGENYFPTVDAEIAGEEDVPNQSLSMRQIMDVLGDAKTRLNLVFLDACRNNPYARSFRSSSDGLSKVNAPSGTLISFATRPGSVAADGTGRNGLYTGALLASMDSRGEPIEQILKRVVTSVKASSKNQQEPWMEGSIEGEFCFGNCMTTLAQMVVSDDRALWDSVKDSRDVKDLQAYLNKFPRGLFAEVAGNRIKAIGQIGTPQAVAAAQIPGRPAFAQSGTTFKDCDDCPEMVIIPAGAFLMGSRDAPDEQPQHSVSIRSFSIGKFEVTREQWFAVMGTVPSSVAGRTFPVDRVSWNDADDFVRKLSQKTGKTYRLPSEAEWEYAARAGSQTAFSFGDDVSQLSRYGWFTSNAGNQTRPVGEKLPNSFGLYDTHGNVWELTRDCWNKNYSGAPNDGSAWESGDCSLRVARGGSVFFAAEFLRTAYRNPAHVAHSYTGFRVARTLD